MKRFFVLAIAVILALVLVACGGGVVANTNNSSLPQDKIDVTNLESLKETYLIPILFSSATRKAWTDPNTIDNYLLVDMYGYVNIWNADIPESEMEMLDNIPYYFLDETILEEYIQGYFAVSVEHLRSSDRYFADRNAYGFNMSGVGFAYNPMVLRAEYDDATRLLVLYLDDGFGMEDGEVATLTIQIRDDGSFQYISNEYSE